jgi:hypothetical protein
VLISLATKLLLPNGMLIDSGGHHKIRCFNSCNFYFASIPFVMFPRFLRCIGFLFFPLFLH